MRLQSRAFGLPLQNCKDPSHNHLHQPRQKWIGNFLGYISLTKILVAPILFYWCRQKLVSDLQIMQQSHDPVNDVFISHYLVEWIANTNFKFISRLEMPEVM